MPVSYDYDSMVTVLFGAAEQRFTVHKDVICVKSKFFRNACSKRWPEGEEKIVRLPKARSTRAFQIYMDWTYTNELVIDNVDRPTAGTRLVDKVIEIYLLGDVLDDVKLRNKALELLNVQCNASDRCLHWTQCNLIWDHTASTSSLRKYLVDRMVTTLSLAGFKESGANYHADLVLQAATMLMERREPVLDTDREGLIEMAEDLNERLEGYMEVEDDT